MHRPRRRVSQPCLGIVAAALVAALTTTPAQAQTITRALLPGGVEPPSACSPPSMSWDGQLVVFGNTGPDPLDGCWDIYLHDMTTGTTAAVVSCHPSVQPANSSLDPEISGDGTTIVYRSNAFGTPGIYVIATTGGTAGLLNISPGGNPPNSASYRPDISFDGMQVSFDSFATNLQSIPKSPFVEDVFVADRVAGNIILISESFAGGSTGNGRSSYSAISANGRHVTFTSEATDLIAPGLDTNNMVDVYVRDRDPDGNGTMDEGNAVTARVSVSSAGAQANNHCHNPVISADGRFVAFESAATTLAPTTFVAFDIYVHDRDPDLNGVFDEGNGVTTLVSVGSMGQAGNAPSNYASISGDGRYVGFRTGSVTLTANATNFWDVYVHDRDPDENGIYDEGNGQTRLVSHDVNHLPGNHNSGISARSERSHEISGDGSRIAFASMASNLVPGDTNGAIDIFVHELCPCSAIDLGYSRTASSGVAPEAKICGDFSAGSFGMLSLRRAPPLSPGVFVLGFSASPTSFFGGTLVPFPAAATLPITTDANGAYALLVMSPAAGLSIVMQWVVLDPGLAPPLTFSNALEVTFK